MISTDGSAVDGRIPARVAISFVGCAAPFGNLTVFPAIPALDGFSLDGSSGVWVCAVIFSRFSPRFGQVAEPLPAHLPLSSPAPQRYAREVFTGTARTRGPLLSMNFVMGMGLRWVFGRCRQLIAPLITGLSIMPFSTYQLVAICL